MREGVAAGELLDNGGFESWSGAAPVSWNATGSYARDDEQGRSGTGARFNGSGTLSQSAALDPGAEASAEVWAALIGGSGTTRLRLSFLNASFLPLGVDVLDERTLTPGFTRLALTITAPPGAAWAMLSIEVSADGAGIVAIVDDASLSTQASPEPTPESPTDTPTAAPTKTPVAEPTATTVGTKTSTPAGTATPSPHPTATTTRPPSGTATPTPHDGPSPPPTPRPPPPTAMPAPRPNVPPPPGSGGLLADGDFEFVSDGAPSFWDNFGGRLVSEPEATRGSWSALLLSDSASTKWVHQAIEVEPTTWYAGSAMARLASGQGEFFIRVSWYLSSDGSGSQIGQDDGPTSSSGDWTRLTFGPVRAPGLARSARFRLMLRPEGGAAALFDDANFAAVPAPSATPTASSTPSATATPARSPGGTAALPPPAGSVAASGTPAATPGTPATVRANGGPPPERSASTTGFGGLRVSEILVDPSEPGRDASYEWVELENTGTEPVDLAEWQLGDARDLDPLASAVVPPGAFIVIAGPDAQLPAGALVVRVADGTIGLGMNNDGDLIRLIGPDGESVDAVSFGSQPPSAAHFSRVPGAGETVGVAPDGSWRLTLRPTPGEANVFPVVVSATTAGTQSAVAGNTGGKDAVNDAGAPEGRFSVDKGSSGQPGWLVIVAVGSASAIGAGAIGFAAARRKKTTNAD